MTADNTEENPFTLSSQFAEFHFTEIIDRFHLGCVKKNHFGESHVTETHFAESHLAKPVSPNNKSYIVVNSDQSYIITKGTFSATTNRFELLFRVTIDKEEEELEYYFLF